MKKAFQKEFKITTNEGNFTTTSDKLTNMEIGFSIVPMDNQHN